MRDGASECSFQPPHPPAALNRVFTLVVHALSHRSHSRASGRPAERAPSTRGIQAGIRAAKRAFIALLSAFTPCEFPSARHGDAGAGGGDGGEFVPVQLHMRRLGLYRGEPIDANDGRGLGLGLSRRGRASEES